MAQLDGSDIVYLARVAVPKLISLRVDIGTRFPAMVTSQGRALLSAMDRDSVHERLSEPSRSGIASKVFTAAQIDEILDETAERGWALADQDLAPGVRSIAVPVHDSRGVALAAMNITVHAAETTVELLRERYLPRLLDAAADTSADWSAWQNRPIEPARRKAPCRGHDFVAIRVNGVTTSNLMTDATLNCAEYAYALPSNPVRSSRSRVSLSWIFRSTPRPSDMSRSAIKAAGSGRSAESRSRSRARSTLRSNIRTVLCVLSLSGFRWTSSDHEAGAMSELSFLRP